MAKNLIKRRAVTDFTEEKGCRLSNPQSTFVAIYGMAGGHPCDECMCKPCKCLDTFIKEDKDVLSQQKTLLVRLKTNAELAAEVITLRRGNLCL